MIHLTIQQLSSFLDGDISEANTELAREHFAACESCTSKLDQLAKLDAALATALTGEPDDSFFEKFPVELEERILSEEAKDLAGKAASAEAAPAARNAPSFHGGVGGAALHSRIARETSPRRSLVEPPRNPQRTALAPGVVALVIVALAGTVGALIFGKELATHLLFTPRPGAGIHADATGGTGTRGKLAAQIGSPVSGLARRASSSTAANSDAPMTEPGDDVWQADSGDELEPVGEPPSSTEFQSTTGIYDDAAAELELSLPSLEGNEYQTARFRLAEARHHAWRLEPGKERAVRAAGALRAFLVGSSPGPNRERAARWLSEVVETGY